jgi:hypothetical protein
MRHSSIPFFSALIAAALALPAGAIHYSVASLGDAEAVVAYSLNKQEQASPPPDRCFVFALTCSPGITCGAAAQSSGPAAVAIDSKVIRSGGAGADYLVWIAFTPYQSAGGAVKAFAEGTITVRCSAPAFAPSLASDASVRGAIVHAPLRQKTAKTHSINAPGAPFVRGVRIEVDKDGIYEISAAQLQRIGAPLSAIPSSMFRLFCKGDEVPLYITNAQHPNMQSDDKILFYGTFLRAASGRPTQFSNTNDYWLAWDGGRPGMRVVEVSGAQRKDARRYQAQQQQKQLTARDFYDTLHLEEDNDIRWLGSVDAVSDIGDSPDTGDTVDNWYWGIIGQNYSSGFTINLPTPSANQNAKARFRVQLMGLTGNSGASLDHNLAITLNDNPLGDTLKPFGWKGQSAFTFVSDPIPQSRIKAGNNVLSFLCQSKFTDMTALNRVDVEYLRTFAALDDKLWFKNNSLDTGGVFEFDIGGYTSSALDLWDIGSYRLFTDFDVRRSTGTSSSSYTLSFQDSLTGVNSYFAQTTGNRLHPAFMRLDTLRAGWDTLAKADYIIVTVDSFIETVKPLADSYKKRGLSVAVVDVCDVYNSFSSGIHDPESIRSFLRYLFSLGGKKTPRYLLLAGDTTHDLDKNRRERNIVPTHLSRVPGWGPSSNDGYFATLGDDNFPALSVGRFPAENKAHMRTLVTKTVHYLENQEPGFWRDNLLLLGGWESDFTYFNTTVSQQVIGPAMNLYRMDADTASPNYKNEFTASKTIADYINAGVYAINFNGHGGGNIWSDSKFFGYNDLDNLYNAQWGKGGKLPFVFSFTCLTGFFESAFYRSLGEEFIRHNANGALCFLGASAYTSKQANLVMNRILLDHAVNGDAQSIGELVGFTKMEMLARYGAQYLPVVRQYNLLGDPALPWSLAPDSLKATLPDSAPGTRDTLSVNAVCAPLKSGQARVVLTANGKKWDDRIVAVVKSSFTEKIPLKDSAKTASGLLHAYAWNDSQQLRGSISFSRSAVSVLNVSLNKETIRFGDTVFVSCSYALPPAATNAAMLCLYTLAPIPPAGQSVGSGGAVSMLQTSAGGWTSGPLPLIFSGRIGDMLFIRFRIAYSSATGPVSDTSVIYSFTIEGRPDLIFTGDTLRPRWDGDSLRVSFQALNAGNAAAPPFKTALFWGASAGGDTLCVFRGLDSLQPGKTRNYSVGIPDTQGTLAITVCMNPGRGFQEISFDNNSATMVFRLGYADVLNPTDSLYSPGKGLCIVSPNGLSKKRRVFLFGNHTLPVKPLTTESSWAALSGDSVSQFSIGVRPALSGSDSLSWIFFRDTTLLRSTTQTAGKVSVALYDSSLGLWRYASGNRGISDRVVTMRSQRGGPFSLAFFSDVKPPDIRASVNGREVVFLDYAAKGKPFNIHVSDASGIVPSSIKIRLNKKDMDSGSVSQSIAQTGLNDMTITAYPRKEYTIDSLSVYAEDRAGNAATALFAYMPGEDLQIKFLSCHPNPFTAAPDARGAAIQTIRFAFLLTDVARDVSLAVYTIGGHVVWKWGKSGGTIGYQEVEWDGKTSNGHRIANGTYYAKLIAVNDSKKIYKNIRIAKLEGY